MVDNVFQVEYAFLLAGPDGLLSRVEDMEVASWKRPPAQDPASVGMTKAEEPAGRHIGEVCYPTAG